MGNPDETILPSVNAATNGKTEKSRDSSPCHLNQHSYKQAQDPLCENQSSTLDLSSRLISEFPGQCLHTLVPHIVCLNIEYNDISDIPSGLSLRLPNLQSFLADGNDLSSLPDDFGDFVFLQELCVCENNLSSLPESLCNLKNLQVLKVSSNSLRQLHSEIGQNSSLQEIHAEENKLKRLPATLGLLKCLHSLIVSDNRIEQLISTIGQCESLKVVDLSRNKLSHLPESFNHLTKLTRVDLSENKISSLGKTFASCACLEKLFLDLNMLGKFPPWFSDLERIQEISMKSNDLGGAAIPEGFGFKSQHLRILDLRGNFIEVLPESFSCLSSLQLCLLGTPLEYLERSPNFQNGNWLVNLPESFPNLTALTKLSVEENQLVAFPKEIGKLVNLEELFFGSNMVNELPASFTSLSSLKICQLSKNRLKRLPEDFGVLSTLTELYLDSNMLRSLPLSMTNLANLEVLDLTENKLKEVPRDILANMKKLRALNMFFNKFDVPYSEIPYIVKRTHYTEKDPQYKNTWRGRNNDSKAMAQSPQNFTQSHSNTDCSNTARKEACSSDEDDDAEPDGADADSSAEEDWDAQIVASSSGSSDLANYMHVAPLSNDDDDSEDWEAEVKRNPSRQLSSDKEEGQFDLDEDDDSLVLRPILPSPVRFDSYGNASRPIDFAVHHHRQTPYIHHAVSINRHTYSPGLFEEGQFDSDAEDNEEGELEIGQHGS
ncbi:leucine-rich repeat protein shoc-2-like [Plakobranchus ocellatus]|uniref:Leucine-rich repeat protein shoc-2-like n=1 Tax=Plakobranchus ocellatus TaxID=259542 RepID=A0AAV4BGG9_9GAST|nr:leucine-rich repeat protein shoc-2-like [Plakobranchus ocellatus]